MTSRIMIEIDDEHQRFGVYWPDGTGHHYQLSPPQTEHSIRNRIADEINRMMMVPELCSDNTDRAGAVQYDPERLAIFLTKHDATLTHSQTSWTMTDGDGNTMGVFNHLSEMLDELEEV